MSLTTNSFVNALEHNCRGEPDALAFFHPGTAPVKSSRWSAIPLERAVRGRLLGASTRCEFLSVFSERRYER
jgi:hypothetical protein